MKKDKGGVSPNHEMMTVILASIDVAVILTDRLGAVTFLNPLAEQYTGWLMADAYGKSVDRIFHVGNGVSANKTPHVIQQIIDGETSQDAHINGVLISKNGGEVHISGKAAALYDSLGMEIGVLLSFRDLSKEVQQEKDMEGVLNLYTDLVSISDLNGNFLRVNRKFEELLGYQAEEIEGKSFVQFVHEDDIQPTFEVMNLLEKKKEVSGFINRFRCSDNSYKYLEWTSKPGDGNKIFSIAKNVTEKKWVQGQIRDQGNFDQGSKSYNPQFLNFIIEEEMSRSDFLGLSLSMAVLDVDYFKRVNDTWGHAVGDDLLKMILSVSRNVLRQSDMIIRLEGEKFLILMPQTTLDGAKTAAEKVRAAIENNWHPIVSRQTVSIGVVERKPSENFTDWFQRVEKALLGAKEAGRNCVIAID